MPASVSFACRSAQVRHFRPACRSAVVEALNDVALETATAEVARPTGAASTALADRAPAIATVEAVTPRSLKKLRNFCKLRMTRFCAARSRRLRASPTSLRDLFSKYRNIKA